MSEDKPQPAAGNILVDLGPLVLFLAAYWRLGLYAAIPLFMLATAAALLWSKTRYGHVSVLALFSAVMVLVFGSLTIWLHDESFIKIKPTIYYLVVAGFLFWGVLRNRPTLKAVMGSAYPDLNDRGWHLLTRNFAWFFLAMAVVNELVWRNSSTGFWLGYKLWGAFPATLLFGFANVPMILRHSAGDEANDSAATP